MQRVVRLYRGMVARFGRCTCPWYVHEEKRLYTADGYQSVHRYRQCYVCRVRIALL